MKNIRRSLAIALLSLVTAYNVKATQDPSVTGATVNPTPINTPSGISVSFNFLNQGTAISSSGDFIQVTASLSELKPAAGFNIATDITGSGAGFFNWSYDSTSKTFTGNLNSAVAQLAGVNITIGNLIVVTASPITAPANGVNVNVVAPGAVNSNTNNDNTASYTYTDNVVPLPVSLVNFSGISENCSSTLTWQTGEEQDINNFVLQYSADGSGFENVAAISPKGSNSRYTYTDKYSSNGSLYYRLAIKEDNDKTTFSNTLLLHPHCIIAGVDVSPNPVSDKLQITITGVSAQEKYNGSLYSETGMLVHTQDLSAGVNYLSVKELPAGVYHLILQNAGFFKAMTIVRQ